MASQNRRAVKYTYKLDEIKWIVVKFLDDNELELVKGTEVENEETGECAQEANLEEGDYCMAKWHDGDAYKAKILFVAGDKEEGLKNLKQLKRAHSNKTDDAAKTRDMPEPGAAQMKDLKAKPTNTSNSSVKQGAKRQLQLTSQSKTEEKNPTKMQKTTNTDKKTETAARIEARKLMVEQLVEEQTRKNESDLEKKVQELEDMVDEMRKNMMEKDEVIERQRREIRQLKERNTENQPGNEGRLGKHLASTEVQEFLHFLAEVTTPGLPRRPVTAQQIIPGENSQQKQQHCSTTPTGKQRIIPVNVQQQLQVLSSPSGNHKTSAAQGHDDNLEPRVDAEMVDLGHGVLMKKNARDNCLASSKGQAPKLVRNLLSTLFSKEVLSCSCARGSKERQALPTNHLQAIHEFVISRHPKLSYRDFIQIVNCHCADSRKANKNIPKPAPSHND